MKKRACALIEPDMEQNLKNESTQLNTHRLVSGYELRWYTKSAHSEPILSSNAKLIS